jgi:hypothetical protein
MIVDNVGASTSHASNESLNVELANVKEAKANFSTTPSVKQTQGKFVPTCHILNFGSKSENGWILQGGKE